MKVSVGSGQSLPDLALQYYGDLEGIHDIVDRNDFDYDRVLVAGELIDVSETPINRQIVSFFQTNNIAPNNG